MSGFTESIGTRLKKEIAKIKLMSFKEKREYIWVYYKIHIIIAVFILIIAGGLINSWFINPPKKDYINIAWMGAYEPYEQLDALAAAFTGALVQDDKKETAVIIPYFYSGEPSYDAAMTNRLMAMVSAREVDIFITDKESLDELTGAGYTAPLSALAEELNKPEYAALNKALSESCIELTFTDDDKKILTDIMAVNLEGNVFLEKAGINTRGLYLSITVNTLKLPHILETLKLMYAAE